MNRSEIQDMATARPVSAADAAEILDVYGENATGRPRDERALIMFAKDVLSRNQARHAEAVQQAEAEMRDRTTEIEEAFDSVDAAVRAATRDLAAGRADARTTRQRLAKADETRRALAARVEQLRADDEAATALAEQDPIEWQAALLAKYPAIRRGLPVMSRAALADHA